MSYVEINAVTISSRRFFFQQDTKNQNQLYLKRKILRFRNLKRLLTKEVHLFHQNGPNAHVRGLKVEEILSIS